MSKKGLIRKELGEIILVCIIIVVVFFIGSPLYAATKAQSTSEEFENLIYDLEQFLESDQTQSSPIPYYIDQGYFLVVCKDIGYLDESHLCICGKDLCKKEEPLSKHKFSDYTFTIEGNKEIDGYKVITGDSGFWNVQGNRGVANVIFSKEDKHITIKDCSVKGACKETEPQEGNIAGTGSDEACFNLCEEQGWTFGSDDDACYDQENNVCYCERDTFGACQNTQKNCITHCEEKRFNGDDCHNMNCLRIIPFNR